MFLILIVRLGFDQGPAHYGDRVSLDGFPERLPWTGWMQHIA